MRYLFLLFMLISVNAFAGDTAKLYNPAANAEKDVAAAVAKAKKEGKHVLIQVGGNWCVWCYRFNGFVVADTALNNVLQKNYIVYHLNYSKENTNAAMLKKLGYPQRFGFPAFVVLDGSGARLHTQDSSLLEKDKGYDKEKVEGFFRNWTPAALSAANYKE